MFALAEIGELPYVHVLETMKYLIREEHYAVWKTAANAFKKIWFHLRGTKLLELFEVCLSNYGPGPQHPHRHKSLSKWAFLDFEKK